MLTIKDIIQATGGNLIQGRLAARVNGISTDSRTLKKSDLYIALEGKRFNGHDFVDKAIKKGVSGVVISQNVVVASGNLPVVKVSDTTKALGLIAKYHRNRFSIPVIAITGSAGKTTTKEMTASVLSMRYRVLKNIATENNHIGVPLTLLRLRKNHEAVVVELGTNHFGEIKWLTEIANPTVAVLTNIGESHLEFLQNRSGVLREKLEIVKNMDRSGVVIFNSDDQRLQRIPKQKLNHRCVRFGMIAPCDYQGNQITFKEMSLQFQVNKKRKITLKTLAKHNVYNALAAVSCGRLLNVSYKDIQKALERFDFLRGRQMMRTIGQTYIMDDTYNSNPLSLRSAIETLGNLRNPGRKIIVCGDMLELGDQTARLHRAVGNQVANSPVDLLITIGKHSRLISQAVRKRNTRIKAYHETSFAKVNQRLRQYLKSGDTVLLKGSRGMHMEKIAEFLESAFGNHRK